MCDWALGSRGARRRARQAVGRAGAATRQPEAYDTAGPGCDTAGPRATIRPLCAPGRACARLGVLSWAGLGVCAL